MDGGRSVCAVTPRRQGGHDDETDARPSPEAQAALAQARRARRATEAVLPIAEEVARQLHDAVDAPEFDVVVGAALLHVSQAS